MGTAPRMPGGYNFPKVLQVPFTVFNAWVSSGAQMGGKTRIWLFCAYNTATISITHISPASEGRLFYAVYDKSGKVIGSTKEVSRTGSISINTPKVEYIEFEGRAQSKNAYAVGTLTATR